MCEEVGEVAKAVRKELGLSAQKPETNEHLAEELVDVLNFIFDIANHYSINLDEAFQAKWHKNESRSWA